MADVPDLKETIVVVVGAGASIRAGLPSTNDLLRITRESLPQLAEPGIAYATAGDHVQSTRSVSLSDILDEALRGAYGAYDFETLLHAIEELETVVTARETPALLAEFRPVLSAFMDLAPRYERIADSQFLRWTRLHIIETIHRHVGSMSTSPKMSVALEPDQYAARAQIHRIFGALSKRYRVVAVTLNYDDIVDQSPVQWADGFGEIATWSKDTYLPADIAGEIRCELFSPKLWDSQVENRQCNLLIHLHGSIRFGWPTIAGVQSHGRWAEPVKFATHEEALDSLGNFGHSGTIVGGQNFDGTPIISGQQKGGKMIYNARPYGYYYRTVMTLVPTARKLLVLGYGWQDAHLNTWIEETLARQDDLRIGVVTFAPGEMLIDNTPQGSYLKQLLKRPWDEGRRLNPTSETVAAGGFHQHGDLGICPNGFTLSSQDEAQLLKFMTA